MAGFSIPQKLEKEIIMFNKEFALDTLERSVKTAAQAAAAMLTADATGLLEVDWVQLFSLAGMAALVSLLTSVASYGVGDKGTASLVAQPSATPAAYVDDDLVRFPPRHAAPDDPVPDIDE